MAGGGGGGGLPGVVNGVGVHEWVLPNAATMGSAVSGEQAIFRPAVNVTRTPPILIANLDMAGLMSPAHVRDLQSVVETKPIVVDYAIRADTLGVLYMPNDDTVTGTGAFPDAMTRVLLIGSAVMTGWYDVTASDGTDWTMERMEGLTYGYEAHAGQMTLCRDTWGGAEPVYCWVTPGGVPIGFGDAKMLPLPAVAMPFGASTPAGVASTGAVGTATTVSRSDHVHAHGAQGYAAGAGLAHPAATAVDPGFMSAAQFEQLADLGAATVVTGSRTDGTALASLLTALATAGIITDSTTA